MLNILALGVFFALHSVAITNIISKKSLKDVIMCYSLDFTAENVKRRTYSDQK